MRISDESCNLRVEIETHLRWLLTAADQGVRWLVSTPTGTDTWPANLRPSSGSPRNWPRSPGP